MALKGPKSAAATATQTKPNLRAKSSAAGKTRVRVKVDSGGRAAASAGEPQPLATAADARQAPAAAVSWIEGHKKELAIVAGGLAAAYILYRIIQGVGGGAGSAGDATTPDSTPGSPSNGATTTPAATTTPTTTPTGTAGPAPSGQNYGGGSPGGSIVIAPPSPAPASPPTTHDPKKLKPKHDDKKHPAKGKTATHPVRADVAGFEIPSRSSKDSKAERTPKGSYSLAGITVRGTKAARSTHTGGTVAGFALYKPSDLKSSGKANETRETKDKAVQHARSGTASSRIVHRSPTALGGLTRFTGPAGFARATLPDPHTNQVVHKTAAKAGPARSIGEGAFRAPAVTSHAAAPSAKAGAARASTKSKAAKAPSKATVHPKAAKPYSAAGHAGVRK